MPQYPPIPKSVDMPGGTVTVVQVKGITMDGQKCWGMWDESERRITLDNTSRLAFRWKVFYHELAHAMLDDAGISNALSHEMIEMLCDAIATARHRERFGGG